MFHLLHIYIHYKVNYFLFRGVYFNSENLGPYTLNPGPIYWVGLKMVNPEVCLDTATDPPTPLCFCVGDGDDNCHTFTSPQNSMYYFDFSSPVNGLVIEEECKVSGWKKGNQFLGSAKQMIREFYFYVKQNGQRQITFSFNAYLEEGDKVWLENDVMIGEDTLFFGPRQYQIDFRIFQYTPVDEEPNEDCQ